MKLMASKANLTNYCTHVLRGTVVQVLYVDLVGQYCQEYYCEFIVFSCDKVVLSYTCRSSSGIPINGMPMPTDPTHVYLISNAYIEVTYL